MGGGRQYFYRSNETDPEYQTRYGSRQDEHNLVQVNSFENLKKTCNDLF